MIRLRSNGTAHLMRLTGRRISSIRWAAKRAASSWSSRRSAKSADSESEASRRRRFAFFWEQDFARTGVRVITSAYSGPSSVSTTIRSPFRTPTSPAKTTVIFPSIASARRAPT